MSPLRPLATLLVLGLLGVGARQGFAAWQKDFSEKWRGKIAAALAKEELSADIGRLTLDPFHGLVAHGIKLYGGPDRQQLLASVSELKLDLDLAKLLQKEQFINSLDLSHTNLSLPLDPTAATAKSLRISNFNAKIVATGDRFEIRKASGDLYGFEFHLTGSLLRPSAKKKDHVPGEKPDPRTSAWETLKEQRSVIARSVHEIHRLHVEATRMPQLMIEVEGDLDHPEDLHARARLDAEGIRYAGYRADVLRAEAEYTHGEVTLRNVLLRDSSGEAVGEARWRRDDPAIPFTLESTADLPGLVRAMGLWPAVREVVFYDGPKLRIAGSYFPGALPEGGLPIEALGRFECGRVASSGVVFDGAQAEFYVRGPEFFVRDILLDHYTGKLTGQAMHHAGDWKYHAHVRMHPSVLAPFIAVDDVRTWVAKFDFSDVSGVDVDVRGGGRDDAADTWRHTVDADLRQIKFQGLPLRRTEATMTVAGPRTTLTNLRVVRPDGEVTAASMVIDSARETIDIRGLQSTVLPAPMVRLFNPEVATAIESYRFSAAPQAALGGTFGMKSAALNNYAVKFATAGQAQYPITGQTLTLQEPSGLVEVRGNTLTVDLQSKIRAGTTFRDVMFNSAPTVKFNGVFMLDPKAAAENRWSLALSAPGTSEYPFAGQKLPLAGLTATLDFRHDRLDINHATATVFGGRVTGSGEIDHLSTTADYSAAIEAERLSFAGLMGLYSPGTETTGVLSGGIHFVGSEKGAQRVRGSGRATVQDGDIFAIPLLGPLSPLLSAVLPGTKTVYGKARQASATFSLQNGTVTTKDFEALTSAFVLKGDGTVNTDSGKVVFNARVNSRGPASLLLFPVSKLLEFEADGTLKDPKWKPKMLTLPMKLLPR